MNEPIWGEVTHGAVFVADSHENEKNHFLEKLWSTLESEESSAPIFLMGDIFDLLFGGIKASFKPHEALLARISELGKRRVIYWFEGNHDFNLSGRVPNVKIIPRDAQPALFRIGDEYAWLAHGDFGLGIRYEIYTKIIRNRALLWLLNALDWCLQGRVFALVNKKISAKNLRWGMDAKKLAKERLPKYQTGKAKWIFEGHFHSMGAIEASEGVYVALPCLACNEKYFVVEFSSGVVLLADRRVYST